MKAENFLKEYVRRLSDDDLKSLYYRFTQNMSGDRADIVESLGRTNDMDKWLRSATTATEFFDMIDEIGKLIETDYARRFPPKE